MINVFGFQREFDSDFGFMPKAGPCRPAVMNKSLGQRSPGVWEYRTSSVATGLSQQGHPKEFQKLRKDVGQPFCFFHFGKRDPGLLGCKL